MTFQNNNKAIMRKLTGKAIKANKIRNLFAIIAIALTSLLFTALFTLSMGAIESFEQQSMRQAGGYAHGTLKNLTTEQYLEMKDHPLIKESGHSVMLNIAENDALVKRQTEIRYMDDHTAKWYYAYPTTGKMPQQQNEIATDDIVLDLLGLPHEIGQTITLEYSIQGKKYSDSFVLSGFWEGDSVGLASQAIVSQTFLEERLKGFDQKKEKLHLTSSIGTGLIFADLMFDSSATIEKDMQKVIIDSGYTLQDIEYGVNWAYMSTSFDGGDPVALVAIISVVLLIIFVGYLIIYNIFQISVMNDIRFYGLLKTIGTTRKQIKRLVHQQAVVLSAVGIPIGLVLGYGIGAQLIPLVIAVSSVTHSYVSTSPIIFIGATLFAAITVFISCRKPAQKASAVSPIEAVKYVGTISEKSLKRSKHSIDGGKLRKMALSNLFRNKKKMVMMIASMSLALILLQSVFVITQGFSIDKFIQKFATADFVVGHVKYFTAITAQNEIPSPQMIEGIDALGGIKASGKTYYSGNQHQLSKEGIESFKKIYTAEILLKESKHKVETVEKITQNGGQIKLMMYGLDDFPLSKLKLIEGEIDKEKLATGDYIIVGTVFTYDDEAIIDPRTYYAIGDKISIDYGKENQKTYTVMAKAEMPRTLGQRFSTYAGIDTYLPSSEFLSQIPDAQLVNYAFDVDEMHTAKMEAFLTDYTKHVEPMMDFESKKLFVDEFNQLVSSFTIIGGVLCVVVAFVGILNFANATLTSIITRRREFAMLQSIGMTNKQLSLMLVFEGLYYALFTVFSALVVGSLFSLFVVNKIMSLLWFFNYHFSVGPLIIATPILLVLAILIPFIAYKGTSKQSIVERLRVME